MKTRLNPEVLISIQIETFQNFLSTPWTGFVSNTLEDQNVTSICMVFFFFQKVCRLEPQPCDCTYQQLPVAFFFFFLRNSILHGEPAKWQPTSWNLGGNPQILVSWTGFSKFPFWNEHKAMSKFFLIIFRIFFFGKRTTYSKISEFMNLPSSIQKMARCRIQYKAILVSKFSLGPS